MASSQVDAELVDRVSGAGRIETAAALSQLVFASPVQGLVLARADDHADALAGAPLAAHVGGPLLLTGREALATTSEAEIRRLRPRTVYLLGGEAALSGAVARAVSELGAEVVRIGGVDRFDTARQVAGRLPAGGRAYVAAGAHLDPDRAWPDAVAVSGLAAGQRRPVLLVVPDRLPAGTRAALEERGIAEVVVVGGGATVSREVDREIAAMGITVRRIGGATRYATSRLIADEAARGSADPARAWLATGRVFADALAAGPAVAAEGGVLLLADLSDLGGSSGAAEWLAGRHGTFEHVRVLGGRAVLPLETLTQIRALADPSTRLLRVRADVEVRDATRPPPFTVAVNDAGRMWNHGRGSHEIVFTATDGAVAIDDVRPSGELRDGDGRMAAAGRGCAPSWDRDSTRVVVLCTADLVPIRLAEGAQEWRAVRLHAEPELAGPGRLQPGRYVLDQRVGWSRDPDRLHRDGPDGTFILRITYTVDED